MNPPKGRKTRKRQREQVFLTDVLARFLLLILLLLLPWPLGSILLNAQTAAYGLLLFISLLALPGLLFRERTGLPSLFVIQLFCLLYVVGQTLGFRLGPSTLYLAQTRLETIRLAFCILACLLGWALFGRFREQRWLWVTLAISGTLQSCFGIVQRLTWNGKLFWSYELTQGGIPFGSFVCRNNGGLYLNLCLGCTFALLIWLFHSKRPRGSVTPTLKIRHEHLSTWEKFLFRLGQLNGPRGAAVLATIIIFAGLIASASRGAMLGTFAGLVLLSFFAGQLRLVLVIGGFTLPFVLGALYWLGFTQDTLARFNLASLTSGSIGRLAHWLTALQAFQHKPVFGYGAGCYRFTYLPFETQFDEKWFVNADNQYVEWLLEGGLVGLALILLVLWFAWRTGHRLVRLSNRPAESGIGHALTFAMAAFAFSTAFDFGITLPANFLTLAVLIGAGVGSLQRYCSIRTVPGRGLLAVALTIGGVAWLPTVYHASQAESAQRMARASMTRMVKKRGARESADVQLIDDLIAGAQNGLEHWPYNADLQLRLGRLLIHRYKMELRDALVREKQLPPEKAWDLSSVTLLHEQTMKALRLKDEQRLQQIRFDRHVEKYLVPAAQHFENALAACPVIPGPDVELARLNPILGRDDENIDRLQQSARLAPSFVGLLYTAGVIALQEERYELMFRLFRRHNLLTSRWIPTQWQWAKTIAHLRQKFSFEEIVDGALPREIDFLFLAANAKPRFSNLNGLERRYVNEVLLRQLESDSPLNPLGLELDLVHALTLQNLGRNQEAVPWFRRAIQTNPYELERRLQFIACLEAMEEYDDAAENAALCRNMFPDDPKLEDLVERLVRLKVLDKNSAP